MRERKRDLKDRFRMAMSGLKVNHATIILKLEKNIHKVFWIRHSTFSFHMFFKHSIIKSIQCSCRLLQYTDKSSNDVDPSYTREIVSHTWGYNLSRHRFRQFSKLASPTFLRIITLSKNTSRDNVLLSYDHNLAKVYRNPTKGSFPYLIKHRGNFLF